MGREAFCLNELGFHVTGVDLSEEVIAIAKQIASKNNVDIEFLVTNGLDLPFIDSCYDVVIIWAQTFGLFYSEPNQQSILAECKRVLKNSGLLSLSAHDRAYLEKNYTDFLSCKRGAVYTKEDGTILHCECRK